MFGKLNLAFALMLALSAPAFAADTPGVTATEIKIGGVFPFSGPASSIGLVGKGVLAYVQSINDRGGINGRKINYIAMDDAYSPPKAVEHVRKLVDERRGRRSSSASSARPEIRRRRNTWPLRACRDRDRQRLEQVHQRHGLSR